MLRRFVIASAVAASALVGSVAAPSARASNVHWNVSIGLPGIGVAVGAPAYGYGYGYAAPVVYGPPAPAYWAPPVVYRPAPVYYGAPVVRPYYRPVVWHGYYGPRYAYRR